MVTVKIGIDNEISCENFLRSRFQQFINQYNKFSPQQFFEDQFWGTETININVVCNMIPYERFPNLTPSVSNYKIWPFEIFADKFEYISWKNRRHIFTFTRVIPFLKLNR